MAFVNTGLTNNGHTQYFSFLYDDTLSEARGRALANDLITFCDRDFSIVAAWFAGVSVDPPITVKINVAGDPYPATWYGWGPWPLEITLNVGESPVVMGTPNMLMRYLIVCELSEIFMRARQPHDWFEAGDEGSKGEALSCFLGVQFLLNQFPGVNFIPGRGSSGGQVTSSWLNSTRDNYIDTNKDDNSNSLIFGCGTLFLNFLHGQLGFGVSQIINAGGPTLADVYSNLTGDSRTNAWSTFIGLVNSHCPQDPQEDGSVPQYYPSLDTIFPVSDLSLLTAPTQVSWVTNNNFNSFGVFVDHPVQVPPIKIGLKSDDESLIHVPEWVFIWQGTGMYFPLDVLQQPEGFMPKTVNITASYIGKTLSSAVRVVAPEQLIVPPLQIVPDMSADSCKQYFVEESSQDFLIKNLNVLADRTKLAYKWSVVGANVKTLDSAVLSIPKLPEAGTKVSIKVTVTNALKVQASGSLQFTTVPATKGLSELQREVACRVKNLRNVNLFIPRWVPVEENAPILREQLARVEAQSRKVMREAEQAIAAIQRFKSLTSRGQVSSGPK